MVGGGLRIGVARHEDAECVSVALKEYGSQVEDDHGAFAVVLSTEAEGEMFTALLNALSGSRWARRPT
jgi:hypothetical protein